MAIQGDRELGGEIFEIWLETLSNPKVEYNEPDLFPLQRYIEKRLAENDERILPLLLSNPNQTIRRYSAIFAYDYFVDNNCFDKADSLYEQMVQDKSTREFDKNVFKREAALVEANPRLDRAISITLSEKDPYSPIAALTDLAKQVTPYNKSSFGKILKTIDAEFEKPAKDQETREYKLRNYAAYLSGCGMIDKSVSVAEKISDPEIRFQAYSHILENHKWTDAEREIMVEIVDKTEALKLKTEDRKTNLIPYIWKLRSGKETREWLTKYSKGEPKEFDSYTFIKIGMLPFGDIKIITALIMNRRDEYRLPMNDLNRLAVLLENDGYGKFVDDVFPEETLKARIEANLKSGKMQEAKKKLAKLEPDTAKRLLESYLSM